MKKRPQDKYTGFLLKLRLKHGFWHYSLLTILFFIAGMSFISSSTLSNLTKPQPLENKAFLYKDILRCSYLDTENIGDPGTISAAGYIDNSSSYSLRYEDENKQTRIYRIDSAALLDETKIVGEFTNQKGEVVIGLDKAVPFSPFVIDDISSKLGFATFNISGYIFLPDLKNPTLFLNDEDFYLTSLYRNYTLNFRGAFFKNQTISFNNNLDVDQIKINGAVSQNKEKALFLDQEREVELVSGAPSGTIEVNPELFSIDRSIRSYKTVLFPNFSDKLRFLETRELIDLFDNFNVENDNNMQTYVQFNYYIIYLVFLFIPLIILLIFFVQRNYKFEDEIRSFAIEEKNLKRGDAILTTACATLSSFVYLLLYLLWPLFFSVNTTIGVVPLFFLFGGLIAIVFMSIFTIAARRKDYETH